MTAARTFALSLFTCCGLAGCVTHHAAEARPELAEFDLRRAIRDSSGEKSLHHLAHELVAKGQEGAAKSDVLIALSEGRSSLGFKEAKALADLYLMLPEPAAPELFKELMSAHLYETRRLAWQIAEREPSPAMAQVVSEEISRRLGGKSGKHWRLSPEIALAASANELNESYPLIREGLMAEGQPAFAKAMIELKPDGAADDLLSYLALATDNEVASGKFHKVNVKTCVVALNYFLDTPPSLHHPDFKSLLAYSASANAELADLAFNVLGPYVEDEGDHLAMLLSQMAPGVRAAFVQRLNKEGAEEAKSFIGLLDAMPPGEDR